MTEDDPYDEAIVRQVIRRHQYEPETKQFRWFYKSAYDNKRQYEKRLQNPEESDGFYKVPFDQSIGEQKCYFGFLQLALGYKEKCTDTELIRSLALDY